MKKIITQTIAPLLSLFLFMLSNGLFMTLVGLRLHLEGFSPLYVGLIGSGFYAGLFFGSFRIESFISRVGHIRAFSAFASFLAVLCCLHGFFVNVWFWLLLRVLSGFCTAGLFIVIESWLMVMSTKINRGRVLAIYMVVLYAGQAIGQFLIQVADPKTLMLFAIAAMLCSLAVIPLAMTKSRSPQIEELSTMDLKKLYQQTASGMMGCLCGGLILGGLYSLLPLYIIQRTHNNAHISLLMAIVIFGGMAIQYPIGKISDIIERRKILMALNIASIITAIIVMFTISQLWLACIVLFIFGGATFTIYPVSISYACDSMQTKDLTAGTQALLLAYSLGATIGPLIGPLYMHLFGSNGLFVYFISVNAFMVIFIGWRRTQHEAVPQEDSFLPVVQTTPVLTEIDPRTD